VNAIDFQTRAIRARRATARIDPWFIALLVAMLAVFAVFFSIGRATGDHRQVEQLSGAQAASRSAASPIRLSSVPPIAIPTIPRVAVAVAKSGGTRVPKVSASDALSSETLRASPLAEPVRQSRPTVPLATKPVAPAPATAPATKPSSSGESTRGGARQAQPSSGSGGTFDSSG
jgi:hypothetical protein